MILITDAIRAAGLPEGEHMLDERPVNIQNGAVRLADGTLAGSVLTMERALQNVCSARSPSYGAMGHLQPERRPRHRRFLSQRQPGGRQGC